MIAHLREAVTAQLMRVQIITPEEQQPALPPMEVHKLDPNTGEDEMAFANVSLVPRTHCRRSRPQKIPQAGVRSAVTKISLCGSGQTLQALPGKYA